MVASPADPSARPATTDVIGSPAREILRDIARGGLAGAVVGLIVIGVGGRLVMRLATILHEGAVGSVTDNGNRIGDITPQGTFGLLVNGLVVGLMAARSG
jgi:hypothetical protein